MTQLSNNINLAYASLLTKACLANDKRDKKKFFFWKDLLGQVVTHKQTDFSILIKRTKFDHSHVINHV